MIFSNSIELPLLLIILKYHYSKLAKYSIDFWHCRIAYYCVLHFIEKKTYTWVLITQIVLCISCVKNSAAL